MNGTSLIAGTHKTSNLEALSSLASRMAREIKAGDVLLLSGELGAGKTTFTQFFAKALGVQDLVTSPTYTLIGEYAIIGNSEISKLTHIDLYRTGERASSVLNNNYIQEILDNAKQENAVVVVEWGELLTMPIKNHVWGIRIDSGSGEGERYITIEG